MPLIGVIDPSHRQRSGQKQGKLPKWLSLEEIWETSQNNDTKWANWTYEMIQAAMGEHQERGDRISVTTLTGGCPRGTVLERKVEYVASLDAMYAPLRGTMIHKVLEEYARPGSIAEARFYGTVDGIEISGSPDLLTATTIYDYKTTENPPTFGYPYRHHTEQLMFNAFLARHAEAWDYDGELPFDPRVDVARAAVVVYLGPKGPKPIVIERKEKFYTPAGVEKERKQPYVWSDDEVLEEMRPRLHAMDLALKIYPEWDPSFTEVWGGEDGWECPGPPLCYLPNCLAKRKPGMFVWEFE